MSTLSSGMKNGCPVAPSVTSGSSMEIPPIFFSRSSRPPSWASVLVVTGVLSLECFSSGLWAGSVPFYGVISPPKIKLCSQLSSFSFKNYVYHFEINIRIQNRFFASNIISFLDNSHISITKTRTTFKFFIHQSTSRLSNKVLASTFILSSLTIKILQ